MPNWCENDDIIIGPKRDCKAFLQKIVPLIEACDMDYNLAPVLEQLGVNPEQYDCRGMFTCIPYYQDMGDCGQISFSTLTAWSSITETWKSLLEDVAPNCEYYHFSVEPGSLYVMTNDLDKRFFPQDYVMDICIDDPEHCPEKLSKLDGWTYWTEQELAALLSKLLNKEETQISDLIDIFNNNVTHKLYGNNRITIIEVEAETDL